MEDETRPEGGRGLRKKCGEGDTQDWESALREVRSNFPCSKSRKREGGERLSYPGEGLGGWGETQTGEKSPEVSLDKEIKTKI